MARNKIASASDMVEKMEAGALCKGIYLTDNLNEVLTERVPVVRVQKSPLGTKVEQGMIQRVFNSEYECEVFESNIDKCSATTPLNIWGLTLNDEPSVTGAKDQNFVAAVSYELVPITAVNLTTRCLELRPEVITALQSIEASIKPSYKPKGRFQQFFQIFGSHFSHGVVEFGGILLSTASCKTFPAQEQPLKRVQVCQASELALKEIFAAESPRSTSTVSVTVKKMGGSQEATSRADWTKSLKYTNCHIIKRSSDPKPIWELLLKHETQFEKPLVLATAMKKEWESLKDPEIQERYRFLDQLRRSVTTWLELCIGMSDTNVVSRIRDLAAIQHEFAVAKEDWIEEVLYIPEVQRALEWSVRRLETITDPLQKQQLSTWITKVIAFKSALDVNQFRNIHEIAGRLEQFEKANSPVSFPLDNIIDLPNILQEQIEDVAPGEEAMFKLIQERLECTIKQWSTKKEARYEYLLSLLVLQQKDFDARYFHFKYPLLEVHFQDIVESLKEHHANFESISSNAKRQGYLLLAAKDAIKGPPEEILESLPGGVCPEIKPFIGGARSKGAIQDLEKLQKDLGLFLEGEIVNITQVMETVKSEMGFIEEPIRTPPATGENSENELGGPLEKFLNVLEMKKFYPQKLCYNQVIELISDLQHSPLKKPTSLPELPWFFLRQVVAINSDARENSCIPVLTDETSDSSDSETDSDSDASTNDLEEDTVLTDEDSSDESAEDDEITSVHILDLIYVIFLCADDFLRQELVDKMSKCQYSIPFILPPAQDGGKDPQHHMLSWAFRSLSRTFNDKGSVKHKTLIDLEAPIVSCLSFEEETSWKGRILNKMLCPQQETFWHQGLEGGDCEQRISQGMVEAAWYLPGGHDDDLFSSPVTFLNCRGNMQSCPTVSNILTNSSSVCCIFVNKITKELKTFLKSRETLQNLLIVVLHGKDDKVSAKAKGKSPWKILKLEKHQVISKVENDKHFQAVLKELKKSMEEILTRRTEVRSLTKMCEECHDVCGNIEPSQVGYRTAQELLSEIDKINKKGGSAKREILPCHSDLNLRREIAAHEKELFRQRKRPETTPLENYAQKIKKRKWMLQVQQLQRKVSEPFKTFLSSLSTFTSLDRRYFLQTLKLGLNERSMEMLQPLYEQYEKVRLENESKEKTEKLKVLDEQIMHGSLGLEHFFREMAVMYENMDALKEKSQLDTLDDVLERFSSIMSDIFVEGTALEIMDGDTVHVPTSWLTAVLNKIENSESIRLFKVSVLGAQSCGKSTILNTAFGLNFPVSSGRCTRGAYMQLVRVDKKFRELLKCDYVLAIDSEGLMSRLRSSTSDHDNELATFVTGLSDLTLVVIKGEGNEMQDVLPLAIHVFLRMNIVGEHQACHFVHQNMGAVGDLQKTATEIDAFVQDLNLKTLAAAKDVNQSDKYTKFSDVIYYNETKDNTYVPGLWDGSLPMAKTKTHYSHTVQKLKSDVLQHAEQLSKRKQFGTFLDFTKRVFELWEAIKYENFLFSFQNVLAVEAYTQLKKVYTNEQWNIKKKVRELIPLQQNRIENEWMGLNPAKTLPELIDDARMAIAHQIETMAQESEIKIFHYFQCMGCESCGEEVQNRHLLINYEKEFKEEMLFLQKKLLRELDNQMDTLEVKLKANVRMSQLSIDMDDILKRKVQEAIRQRKGHASEMAPDETFEELWRDAAGDILRMTRSAEEKVDIKAAVQDTITKLLGKDGQFFVKQKIKEKEARKKHYTRKNFQVNVNKHLQPKRKVTVSPTVSLLELEGEDFKLLQDEAKRIIDRTSRHYWIKPGGRKFDYKHGELLFQDVLNRIQDIERNKLKITNDFKIDLLLYIESLAVPAFINMDEKHHKESSPEALLKKKKKSYYDLFMIMMGQVTAASVFCENVLQDLIQRNVEEKLSCTELSHELRENCGEIFRDIKSLQAAIMVDLLIENSSQKYIDYVLKYEEVIRNKLWQESVKYFTEENRFKKLALKKLNCIIDEIQHGLKEIQENGSDEKAFIKAFFSHMKNLKVSRDEAIIFLDLEVSDKIQFVAMVHREIHGDIKRDMTKLINLWHVEEKLRDRDLVSVLFSEIVGCSAACPFCGVPCDAHTGGKATGDHSSTLHRPQGLGGMRSLKTKRLTTGDCRTDVASRFRSFAHGKHQEFSTQFRKYKKAFPDWTIHPHSSPEKEKYWKWVFSQHNEEFAKAYRARQASIRKKWAKISKKEIKKDMKSHYNVETFL